MTEARYMLRCVRCGLGQADDGVVLCCTAKHAPSFLRTEYSQVRFTPHVALTHAGRFADWLPVHRAIVHGGLPGVFRSERLAGVLGLHELWIAFCGYWPERGASLLTCSFKELEAAAVCARQPDNTTLVLASAGNTARAFAELCSKSEQPVVIVVPQAAVDRVWTSQAPGPRVRLVAVTRPGAVADYNDAIAVAELLAQQPGHVAEGGARNVARRDGLAIVMLESVRVMGRLPRHYFQAIGSGSGAIAAWEASHRLLRSDREGYLPRLHLAQNAPFSPVADAWEQRSDGLATVSEQDARAAVAKLCAPVLGNRTPPYAVAGGVRDALMETDGRTYRISNATAEAARQLFEDNEGIDIEPAAAVATAALIEAVRTRSVPLDQPVLLNITGGGERLRRRSLPVFATPAKEWSHG